MGFFNLIARNQLLERGEIWETSVTVITQAIFRTEKSIALGTNCKPISPFYSNSLRKINKISFLAEPVCQICLN